MRSCERIRLALPRLCLLLAIVFAGGCVPDGNETAVLAGAPATHEEIPAPCLHQHRADREERLLPAPPGGWSGSPQAVVVMNVPRGEIDISHGDRARCGTLQDGRTLDSRFRSGMGTVLVPEKGDTAPIRIGFDRSLLPLWRPVIELGEPSPVQRRDTARFSLRVAAIAVMLALVASSLLTFLSTRERAYLTFALTATVFAAWLALVSGFWAWPRPWLPLGDAAVRVQVGLAIAVAGIVAHALARASWLRRRVVSMPSVSRVLMYMALLVAVCAGVMPEPALAWLSVAIEYFFYLACAAFAAASAVSMTRRRGGLATAAGLLPFLLIAVLQLAGSRTLALWKVEAFMLAGCWLAVTSSMVLMLRLGSLRKQRDEMQHLAQTDALTQLPNRRAALERLSLLHGDAVRTGHPLSVVFIDVDHFKLVNDTHGHAVGDRALQHVADVLRTAFRSADYLARMGGEEFLVILPGANATHACVRAEAVRTLLAGAGTALGIPDLRLTVSAGVGTLQPGDDSATLLRSADAAMYAAKHGGRDRVERFDAGMHPVPAA